VKIAGAHAGVSVGPDGATHQMTEDIAIMRVVPNMVVLVPCDVQETRKATVAAAKTSGPVYLRFARDASPVFTTPKTPFKIGRAETFRFGDDLTIIAAGPLLYEALLAADQLSREQGIETRVIDCHSIKPLDVKTIVQAAKETGAIVTVEEAQAVGGLGGAVCETLAAFAPVPVERIGMPDCFGESGTPSQLLDGFGLTAPSIAAAAIRVLKRKHGERVPLVAEHITAAAERLQAMKQQTIAESLSRTPKKWGGKHPDNTLKSRTTKPA
jgi:transketolase